MAAIPIACLGLGTAAAVTYYAHRHGALPPSLERVITQLLERTGVERGAHGPTLPSVGLALLVDGREREREKKNKTKARPQD